MRPIAPAIVAARSTRAGILVRYLLWITAKDRVTGDPASVGFWSGDDHEDFSIRGQSRTYFGAGSHQGMDGFVHGTGVKVQQHRVRMSFKPEVEQAARGYELRFAPCEVHRAEYSIDTGLLLAEPEMLIDGEVGKVIIKTGAVGGNIGCELVVHSNAIFLTRPLSAKRSDESLRARAPNDAFMKYANISGAQGDPWGANRKDGGAGGRIGYKPTLADALFG